MNEKQSKLISEKVMLYPEQTQLSLALIKNGEVEFLGLKKVKKSITNLENHHSVFEIGSITKVFTATILAKFVLDERVGLDDKINDYLDFDLRKGARLSFKELANHTSGLPSIPLSIVLSTKTNPYKLFDNAKLQEFFMKKMKLSRNRGKKYKYSNLGAGFLGYVLCHIAKTGYKDLLTDSILTKYNMKNTTVCRKEVSDKLIKGLNNKGRVVPNWDLASFVGAGGILSTVEDLSNFAVAQFDASNAELELTRRKTFTMNKDAGMGLGWHILNINDSHVWYFHNGGTGGYRSSMVIDIEKKNGVIILSNVSSFSKKAFYIDRICYKLMESLNE